MNYDDHRDVIISIRQIYCTKSDNCYQRRYLDSSSLYKNKYYVRVI